MALATCRDCNREVSTLARHCVHCGRPRPAGTGAGSVIAGVAAVVLALVLTGAVVCAARKTCKRLSTRASAECQERVKRFVDCSDSFAPAKAADKSTFIKSLEGAELYEVSPGLYRLQKLPPPAEPKEERN
jgi:hypothetical protein